MRRRVVIGALVGLIVSALSGLGGAGLRFDAEIPPPLLIGSDDSSLPTLNLVVLGDSYASAALPFDRGTLQVLGAPSVCARGPAWPRLLKPANIRLSLTHVSCSGAVVADLVDRRMRAGEPLQVQALTADTDVVMLGIGGNDAGFSSVFAACRSEDAAACIAAGQRMKPQAAALSGTLVRLYRTILAKAPNAVVIVVMYADSLPTAGSPDLDACSALRAPGDSISDADLAVLNEWGSDIANRVRGAVAAVDDPRLRVADLADAFLGHRLCDPVPYQWGRDGEIPFHPNAAGHAALAARLSAVLDTLVTEGAVARR
ncbi:MAG: SGNH/GDSL hydrolase family protein [Chloroflexi bacterium]|nr:SGNH/GDSL hydrolase family protein [Chloroflexota bacterium]